ncbi:MAG: cytochrome P450 [Bacteroidota bacterium]
MSSPVAHIPSAKSLPFLGSSLSIYRQGLQAFAVEHWRKHGDVFRAKILNTEFVFLAGPEANTFFTKNELAYFSPKEVWDDFAREAETEVFLAAMEGKELRALRKITKKPYSRQYLEQKWDRLWTITDEFLTKTENQNKPIFPLMQELVCEQIGLIALNSSAVNQIKSLSAFLTTLLGVTTGVYPKLALKSPGYISAKKEVLALGKRIVDEHTGTQREEPDVLDYFMEACKTDPDLVKESDLVLSAIGPYIAGIDTAASSMAFIMYAMTHHQVQHVVKKELAEMEDFSAGNVQKAVALQALVAETMRMYVTTPAVPRMAEVDFEFGGHMIPKGQRLMIASGVAHYAEKFYPEPGRFILERCMPPRMEHRKAGAWVPFGLGSHTCAGAGFAKVQIAATIACLLSKCTVHTNEKLELEVGRAVYPGKKLVGGWRRDDRS